MKLNINFEEMDSNEQKLKTTNGGIDMERLINKDYLNPLGDFYKCSICSKIMINPTDCEGCGHSFCYECISKTKCPFGCENKNLKPASNGITNLLNNLKFKCTNEGCEEIINYIDIKTHENLCHFQKMICPNKECNEQLIKKDLEKHIKDECKYTMIKCDNCGNKIPRYQMPTHEKMCNLAYQSFNSSNSNILNMSGNNIINEENNDNKKENDNKNYRQILSENIGEILKEKNNIYQNEENENDIKKDNNLPINKSNENLNDKIILNNVGNISNNIFDEDDKNDININNNNIFNNEINQNDSMDNNINNINNNDSRLSLKQSPMKIDDDYLINSVKKGVEEKLNEKFVTLDSNLEKILNDIKTIKTFVCKINNNENKNINNNIINDKTLNNRINEIKESLKDIVNKAENNISDSIKGLNEMIKKEIEKNKKEKNQKKNINVIIDEDDVEENKKIMNDINKKIDTIANKILENIKKTDNEINNINKNYKEEINKLINEKNDEEYQSKEINFEEIETKLKNFFENNNKAQSENITKLFEDKINNIKSIYESNEFNKVNEINNNINDKYQLMNKDINNINTELEKIKTNLKEISTTISEQFSNILNSLKDNHKSNDNKVIKINKALIKDNINDFSFRANEENMESPIKLKKKNTNETIQENNNLNIKPVLNERLKKNLQKNDKINNDSYNSAFKEDTIETNDNNKNKIINILSGLESKLDLIDSYAKDLPNLIRDKLGNNLENNILNIGKKITNDIENKIDSMFEIKYCVECDKVDYFYAFIKCSICQKNNCKNCISICPGCKKLICKNCCQCPVCKNIFCLNCRISCEICKNKFCKLCILKCSFCNKNICPDCLKKCKFCQNFACQNCSSSCELCNKCICNKCISSKKNENNFIQCDLCEKSSCNECEINCNICNNAICKKCKTKCNLCDKNICLNCVKKCGNCEQFYCNKCASDFEKTKCNICNTCFCYNCISKVFQCKKCGKYMCKNCYINCPQCNLIFCTNENTCIKTCSNCQNKLCSNCCQYKCTCGMFNYCGKCLLLKEELSPHQCTKFYSEEKEEKSKLPKTKTLMKLKPNFEAKFFLEKKSNKGRTLIGLTDVHENILENDEGNVWTMVIGSGEKYSTEKKLEQFLVNDVNEGDDIFIMKKNGKLFFRINNDEYKLAYELKNEGDFFIYLENTNSKYPSKVNLIYIRDIDEEKI